MERSLSFPARREVLHQMAPHVYAPASEYILALKITMGRQKDLEDCAILLLKTKIRTRKQAQQVLDRYILPSGQQKNAESIENALDQLFGREG